MQDTPLIAYECILTRVRAFLSRSVNLIIVIAARRYATPTAPRTLYLRTHNRHVFVFVDRARMRARDVSDVMSVRRPPLRGFRVHYAIIPAAAYRYNVHRMRIT